MRTFLFVLGTSLLLGHEMDAMLRNEWRLLFVLREMPDVTASWWFIYLHVPFFMAAIYLGNISVAKWREPFRLIVCGFLPVHATLHFLLSGEPHYDFHHILSELLIYAAGVCGVAYLAVLAANRRAA